MLQGKTRHLRVEAFRYLAAQTLCVVKPRLEITCTHIIGEGQNGRQKPHGNLKNHPRVSKSPSLPKISVIQHSLLESLLYVSFFEFCCYPKPDQTFQEASPRFSEDRPFREYCNLAPHSYHHAPLALKPVPHLFLPLFICTPPVPQSSFPLLALQHLTLLAFAWRQKVRHVVLSAPLSSY